MTIPSVLVVAMVRDAAEGGAVVVAFLAVMVLVLVTGAAYCHTKGRQWSTSSSRRYVYTAVAGDRCNRRGPGAAPYLLIFGILLRADALSAFLVAFSLCFFARIPRTPKGYCVRVLKPPP